MPPCLTGMSPNFVGGKKPGANPYTNWNNYNSSNNNNRQISNSNPVKDKVVNVIDDSERIGDEDMANAVLDVFSNNINGLQMNSCLDVYYKSIDYSRCKIIIDITSDANPFDGGIKIREYDKSRLRDAGFAKSFIETFSGKDGNEVIRARLKFLKKVFPEIESNDDAWYSSLFSWGADLYSSSIKASECKVKKMNQSKEEGWSYDLLRSVTSYLVDDEAEKEDLCWVRDLSEEVKRDLAKEAVELSTHYALACEIANNVDVEKHMDEETKKLILSSEYKAGMCFDLILNVIEQVDENNNTNVERLIENIASNFDSFSDEDLENYIIPILGASLKAYDWNVYYRIDALINDKFTKRNKHYGASFEKYVPNIINNIKHNADLTAGILGYVGPLAKEAVPYFEGAIEGYEGKHLFYEFEDVVKIASVIGKIDPSSEVGFSFLAKKLKDNDYLWGVVDGLGSYGKRAMPVLINAWEKIGYLHRGRAIEVFGKIGSDAKDAVPLLLDVYYKQYHSLGDEVESAFKKIGSVSVPYILQHLEGNDEGVRRKAIKLLGKMEKGAVDALPTLKEMELSDPSEDCRETASDAIKSIEKPVK